MKIRIYGNSCSGKTTLASNISKYYNINKLHLDSLNFQPNWVENTREDFVLSLNEFLNKNNEWVIDGNYKSMTEICNKLCDTVIFIDLPIEESLKNANKRYEKYKGTSRPELDECIEKLDDEFIEWIKNYNNRRLDIITYIEKIRKNKDIKYIIISNMKELDNLNEHLEILKK